MDPLLKCRKKSNFKKSDLKLTKFEKLDFIFIQSGYKYKKPDFKKSDFNFKKSEFETFFLKNSDFIFKNFDFQNTEYERSVFISKKSDFKITKFVKSEFIFKKFSSKKSNFKKTEFKKSYSLSRITTSKVPLQLYKKFKFENVTSQILKNSDFISKKSFLFFRKSIGKANPDRFLISISQNSGLKTTIPRNDYFKNLTAV